MAKPYIEKIKLDYKLFALAVLMLWFTGLVPIEVFKIYSYCIFGFLFLYQLTLIMQHFSEKVFNAFVFLGNNTIPIFIFHYIGFKCISYLYILVNNAEYDNISSFPIILNQDNSLLPPIWRFLYLIGGLIVPLLIIYFSIFIKGIIRKYKKIENID